MKDAISLDKETSKGLRLSFETLSELGIDTDFNVQIINKPHEYVYIFVETDATNHDRGNTTDGIMIEMRYSKETGKIIHQFVR
ncbi:hypothetical protein OE749_08035 [Aestuariibacter sp. AA17]|uniref:Uncharacterized protein n=1 Tax=Fluctibacter corallii TaxID=2984329 RepID=A0ABT3A7U2_9ALTE|nr:hypothetical protein [Aestuariibacter sp. AA17]MCV2884642.1 hypothetical protein [Aestuariibacter sp. AA17]